MKTTVLAVGSVRDAHYRGLCEDYAKRIQRFSPLDIDEVKDGRGLDPEQARVAEGERILRRLRDSAYVVALDGGGRTRSSEDLAAWLDARSRDRTRGLTFVVGGPFGLSDAVLARCRERLSLSAMTLPHELARTVLLEQLYRAWTILRRLPYHHS